MTPIFVALTVFVLRILSCSSISSLDCHEVYGQPDGITVWQHMEYAHGIRIHMDNAARYGGVSVYVGDFEGAGSSVQVTYLSEYAQVVEIKSARVSVKNSKLDIPGPQGPWFGVVVQGGDIFGFTVDAVKTRGTTYRAFVPVLGQSVPRTEAYPLPGDK